MYLEANRLHFWLGVKSSKFLKIWVSIFILYLISVIASEFIFQIQSGLQKLLEEIAIGWICWAAVMMLFAAVSYFLLPRQSRKLFNQQIHMHQTKNIVVTDDILEITTNFSNINLPYYMAFKWAENSKVFLIYHSERTFQVLPKDESSSAAINKIRSNLVASNRPGKAL
jgi:YcxB-like protein